MDSQKKSTEGLQSPRERRRRFILRLAIPAFLLLAAIAFIFLSASFESSVIWLKPSDVTSTSLPRALVDFKNKLKTLTTPIWQHFRRSQPFVVVSCNLLLLTHTAAEQTGLGAPASINANGLRAWILSPQELMDFNQRLKTIPGATSQMTPGIQTFAGQRAQVEMTQSVSANLNSTNSIGQNSVTLGTIVDILPKVIRGSINLKLAVSSTELAGWNSDGTPQIRTNLSAACRVLVPNGGGLVLDGGGIVNTNGTNYWLIVSPKLVDPRGKPIKSF